MDNCIHRAIAPNINRCSVCGMVWNGERWEAAEISSNDCAHVLALLEVCADKTEGNARIAFRSAARAVAEYLAANDEYDAAKLLHSQLIKDGFGHGHFKVGEAWRAFREAEERRATARARIGADPMSQTTAPLDVQAVLEFAGADINAAPGSVPHSLALVAERYAEIREKLRSCEEALQAVEADRDALVVERDALREAAQKMADTLQAGEGEISALFTLKRVLARS